MQDCSCPSSNGEQEIGWGVAPVNYLLCAVYRTQLHPQPDRGLAADAADARESNRMFSEESASPLALPEAQHHVSRSGTQAASHLR